VVHIFGKHRFQTGIHGTSLWNKQYKDIDVLVFSPSEEVGVEEFHDALQDILVRLDARLLNQKGNETIGIDCEVGIHDAVFHISYVVLLN
jgi:hypothetical protein